MSDVGDDVVAVPEVRGEHAVVSGEVGAWAWDQRGKPGNEVEGVEDDVSGPVTEGVLESVDDLSPFIDREAFVGECRAGDVAAQAFEGVALVGMAHGAGMEGASRELSDAGGGRRRAGRDGVQGIRSRLNGVAGRALAVSLVWIIQPPGHNNLPWNIRECCVSFVEIP